MIIHKEEEHEKNVSYLLPRVARGGAGDPEGRIGAHSGGCRRFVLGMAMAGIPFGTTEAFNGP